MSFDINLIVFFVAVADELSFHRAATKLNVAQPWISRQVRKLESELGYDLFIRTTRHVELTEQGKRLLERARITVHDVTVLRTLARSLYTEHLGQLRFGVPFFAIYMEERLTLFDKFAATAPSIRLEIVGGTRPEILSGLRSGTLDAGFIAGHVDEPGLDILTLCEGPIEIVIPETDPLAAKPAIHMNDIKGREIAVFSRSGNVEFFDELFGVFEAAGLRTMVEHSNMTFVRGLESSNAITAVPSWGPRFEHGTVRRRLADCDRTAKFQLVRLRGETSPILERFWNVAKEVAKAGPAFAS